MASQLARAMVMRWGMSDKIGNIDYAEAHEGYSGGTPGFSVSAKTKEIVETEVKSLIDNGYKVAKKIILEKSEEFERLAQGLLEYETLTGEEIKRVMRGEPPHDDDDQIGGSSNDESSITAIPKSKKPKGSSGIMKPKPI
jgi:cell division protease FtsH